MFTPTFPCEDADVGIVGFYMMKLKLSFFCVCCVSRSLGDCRFLVTPARFYFGVAFCVTAAEILYGLIVTTRDADL